MAGEIVATLALTVLKDKLDNQVQRSATLDMTTAKGGGPGFQTVGTSEEALGGLSDLNTKGIAFVENLDNTNYIQIGVLVASVFYPLLRVKAEEFQFLRFDPDGTPYVKANTAAVDADIRVFDD